MKKQRVLVSARMLFLILLGFKVVTAMSDVWVELRAPRFIVHKHSATLRCEHSVKPEFVYKVVFFKDGHRIMQYINGRDPPFELYNFTGADLTLSEKTMTSSSITLHGMDFSASGSYACEVTMETPIYSKVSKLHDITVMVRQKHRPKIKIKHRRFLSSDVLQATCQSAPAHPAPHLSWFINNVKVDESLTTPNGVTMHRSQHGIPLSVTSVSLHYPLTSLHLVPNKTVDISCLGTIPSFASDEYGFADLQNHTISVNVVRLEPLPTQMPAKIIEAHRSRAGQLCAAITLTVLAVSALIS